MLNETFNNIVEETLEKFDLIDPYIIFNLFNDIKDYLKLPSDIVILDASINRFIDQLILLKSKLLNEDYNRTKLEQISFCKDVLIKKAREYASQDDRLHNFESASEELNCRRSTALLGMAIKHYVSIKDIVLNFPEIKCSKKVIDEKFGDLINYMILLKGTFRVDNS